MAGIASFGAYVPRTRLPLALLSGRPAAEGGPEKAIAHPDEDAMTLAVAAARDCLRGLDRRGIDAVYFASTTYPFREKQGAALLARALNLRRDVLTQDFAGSLRAGLGALEAAIHGVASGGLREALVEAGRLEGECVWPMPLFETYDQDLESKVADWKNVGPREAGAGTAAWFLSKFAEGRKWAHLDIAGVAHGSRQREDVGKGGATGFGVRLLVRWLESLA